MLRPAHVADGCDQSHGRGDGIERAYVAGAGRRYLYQAFVASPGYFAQQGQWAPVGIFAVLLGLAVVSTYTVTKTLSGSAER
jgi:hypothetical protein